MLSPFGSISRSHGLKGEVLINRGSLEIASGNKPKVLWLGESAQVARPWAVEYLRGSTKTVYLKLRDINSRQEADYLSGLQIFKEAGQKTTVSIDDLVGYQARIVNSSENHGVIRKVDEANPQALYVVQSGNRTFLVPAVADLIEKIDHENRIVYYKDIEGLFPA